MRPEYPRFSIPMELLIPLNFSPYQLRLSLSGHVRYAVVIQDFTRNCNAIFDRTQSNTPSSTNIVVDVDLLLISSRRANADQLTEFLHIDVAPGNDGDDRSFAGFPGQRSRDRQSAGAFGKRLLEVLEYLRRSFRERKRGGRGRLRLNPKNFDFWLQRFDCAADARNEPAAAYASDDRFCVRRVFKNFETHRAMTSDEIVIVEWMHKRAFCSGKRTLVERFPSGVVSNRD